MKNHKRLGQLGSRPAKVLEEIKPDATTTQSHARYSRIMRSLDRRLTAWTLYVTHGFSQIDIANAMKVSQPRISNMLKEIAIEKRAQIADLMETQRAVALERVQQMRRHWEERAEYDIEAAAILLKWEERGDKLNGLHLTAPQTAERKQTASIDLEALNEEELRALAAIIEKAERKPEALPAPEDESVVAV